MASTCKCVTRHVIGSSVVEISRPNNRSSGAPFSVRISAKSNGGGGGAVSTAEGPSCIFVGPIETASKETLEALYCQARDAYYSGKPLIVDDMFDRVELKLRWYGSKSVVKYPRCSLRRQSAYADAEEDLSQVITLASIWIMIFAFGCSACLVPIIYTVGLAYHDAFDSGPSYGVQTPGLELLAVVNAILFMALGSVIGYPIASASGRMLNCVVLIRLVSEIVKLRKWIGELVKVLQGLWRNHLVALKGACPNCGEEVFAFVESDQSNKSPHRADCHVCECVLEFRTKVEESVSILGRQWVHGRIYHVSRRGRSRRQKWM